MKGGNIFMFDIQGDFRFFREIWILAKKLDIYVEISKRLKNSHLVKDCKT